MEMQDTAQMAPQAVTQGGRPNIQIPAPQAQVPVGGSDEEMEAERRYKIVPLEPSRYLKEKETGHIHKWSPEFGARSDLMEAYNPSLAELIQFGETAADLLGWGFQLENLWQDGISAEQLQMASVSVEDMIRIGVPPEKLQELGYAIQIEAAPAPDVIIAPATPKIAVPATAPTVQTSVAASPLPTPPGA